MEVDLTISLVVLRALMGYSCFAMHPISHSAPTNIMEVPLQARQDKNIEEMSTLSPAHSQGVKSLLRR